MNPGQPGSGRARRSNAAGGSEQVVKAPAVHLQGVSRKLGEVTAVNGLDLEVESAVLYGLVGPDGAGKTSTIRLVVGLMEADSGEVRVLDTVQGTRVATLRDRVGYMPQQYSLYGDLSVSENMGFFGRLFGLGRQERAQRKEELLRVVGLSRFPDRRADDLSGGMYKKLALACALLHRPELLVLDEPTNGVDPVSRRELWALLYELVDDGMTVIVSTPDMEEASRCHRVALLHEGRCMAEGEPERLVSQLQHRVVSVASSNRNALERELLKRPDVLDCSPEGARLRVLARGEGTELVESLQSRDDTRDVSDEAPRFEDVFLALLQDPEAVGASPSGVQQ